MKQLTLVWLTVWRVPSKPRTDNVSISRQILLCMICHTGGFPTIRLNKIWDITTFLLTEVAMPHCCVLLIWTAFAVAMWWTPPPLAPRGLRGGVHHRQQWKRENLPTLLVYLSFISCMFAYKLATLTMLFVYWSLVNMLCACWYAVFVYCAQTVLHRNSRKNFAQHFRVYLAYFVVVNQHQILASLPDSSVIKHASPINGIGNYMCGRHLESVADIWGRRMCHHERVRYDEQ